MGGTDPSETTNTTSSGGSAGIVIVTGLSCVMARKVKVEVTKVEVDVEGACADNVEYVICAPASNTAAFPKEESNVIRKDS